MSRPDEREVEAVKAVLLGADLWIRMRMDEAPLPPDAAHDIALDVLSALGRVRDARSDDPASPGYKAADAWNWGGVDTTPAARSPQGEDHEAGGSVFAHLDRPFLEGLYSRALRRITELEEAPMSPSRAGSVAVEDVAAMFRAKGAAVPSFAGEAEWAAKLVEAEFSRPSTKDPPDPT